MTRALIASLRSTSGDMTPALAKIAEFVLAHPDTTLYQSITELAECSGSSEASVIRFCRDQGYTGFQDFKLALAKELAIDQRGRQNAEPADNVQRLVEAAIAALRETEQLIDRRHIAKAAGKLLVSSAIECFGVAASSVTAHYLAYKMTRVGKMSRAQNDAHLAMMAAGTAGKNSVHVIVSSSGSTVDSVEIAKLARSHGAFVIGISNRSKSPLAAVCDLTLIASWPETPLTGGAFPSKISQLLIIDALTEEMMRQDPSRLAMIQLTAESVSERSY